MPSMSNHFITKSMKATSFDYDTDAHPDPQEVHDLFEWLDDNLTEFHTFPPTPLVLITDFSTITFKDTSQAIIQSVYINDWIGLTEKVNPYSQEQPAEVMIHQTSRAGYTYFKLMAQRQKKH